MDMIYTLSQIEATAQGLLKKFGNKPIWAFHAPMGAGKTTLISELCKQLGVLDRVNSPTFAIMNEYQVEGKVIYHMDWYRLQNEAEASRAGVEMALEEAHYCFIEWPERAIQLLPADTQHFEIEILDPEHRRIFIP
ncbi:MAG: tRNA (adenosine(37)-N6)-threonylcarbamoyltransferase complex ATPase subunit type 1 TsaE [Chitinophagia bacterium]|jgi:tRNA threonylcarbamoyladenosine biosynthesis protein TsaE